MQKVISKDYIKRFLPKNPIILEAGANKGRDTIKMVKVLNPLRLYAFEPVDYLYKELVENTKDFKDIVYTFNIALSDRSGLSDFYISSGASLAVSSLLKPFQYIKDRPNVKFDLTKILTITIDEWALKYGISAIDFLWLDMQGAELLALNGAKSIIDSVKAIFIEASLNERFLGNALVDDVKKFMNLKDFMLDSCSEVKHNKVNLFFVR
jgi:FkbM family methyltransferase